MIKCYAKIFVVTGLFFFLAELFSDLTILPFREALGRSISTGLFFGGVLTLVMGTFHILKVRKAAGGKADGDIYSVRQERRFEVGLERSKAFTAAENYLGQTRGFSFSLKDPEAGVLEARTPFNFTTFGNILTVSLSPSEGGKTPVAVTSRPVLFITLADYGDNYTLAKETEEHLRALG